jgi:hypothetical protein
MNSNNNWKEKTYIDESAQQILELEKHQEKICNFFAEQVKVDSPYLILQKLYQTFIDYQKELIPAEVDQALRYLIESENEAFFFQTIKRCCYILIKPLIKAKKYPEIHNLIQIFDDLEPEVKSKFLRGNHLIKNKIKSRIHKFITTTEYRELKLLIFEIEPLPEHWTNRYLEYIFFAQYFNHDNCQEQRDIAIIMVLRIQKQFKFNLAMYLTKSDLTDKNTTNPTILNKNILRFIKLIAVRKGKLSYPNLAKIFLEQTKDLTYFKFHLSFIKYLTFSLYDKKTLEIIESKLALKLQQLYQGNNDKKFNEAFLLRTCNKSFDLLLNNNGKPSDLFVLFMTQSNPYTIVSLLLKIILISPNSRNHLDKKISELVRYYSSYGESDCKWFVRFLEVFKVTFAIYADENIQYNLVKVKETSSQGNLPSDLDCYQFFLKYKKK